MNVELVIRVFSGTGKTLCGLGSGYRCDEINLDLDESGIIFEGWKLCVF
jgi:hypothetical protein